MFAMVPLGVLAITQFPTTVDMGLQLSADPEVVRVPQELRDIALSGEDRRMDVPFEMRRMEILEGDTGSGPPPRQRRM